VRPRPSRDDTVDPRPAGDAFLRAVRARHGGLHGSMLTPLVDRMRAEAENRRAGGDEDKRDVLCLSSSGISKDSNWANGPCWTDP